MPETRTYADRAEYLKKAVTKRRKKLRDMALEYGGGKLPRRSARRHYAASRGNSRMNKKVNCWKL